MIVQVKNQIRIDVPAQKSWKILAHDFDKIDQWCSLIHESKATRDSVIPPEAKVGGRVCLGGPGGDAQETFTAYDEQAMAFSYQALGKLPPFLNRAGNNWSVQSLQNHQSLVQFRGEVDLNFLGILLLPLLELVGWWMGNRVCQELKYFAEHDQPHPRKVKLQQKLLKKAVPQL